jgi:NADH:ubiquinone oxidoreductase subunit K
MESNFFCSSLAIVISVFGLASILMRKSFLGVLIASQILFLGLSLLFVALGRKSAFFAQGCSVSFFIMLFSLLELVVGFILIMRLFYKKKTIFLDQVQTQKR